MTTIRVREAHPDEAGTVRELGRAAWHAAYDDILGPSTVDDRIDNWWRADDLRSTIAEPEHQFLVATDDNAVVGIIHAGPHPERAYYVVPRLYVHPDRWGEGIGTRLLEALVDRVGAETDRLRAVALAGNTVGIGFFEAVGFERVEAHTDLIDAGQEELVYELRLEE